ncbi:FecR family protein [Bacteroides sp. 519]|uniref:FecR family protein n=1 Tax=Bacteroides sp. 519 TaxID=2302937 RepID=UPI0013D2C50B|nr:FecR domain-containing protein [Bacteroides sp. 519]
MSTINQQEEYWLNLIIDYFTNNLSDDSRRELEEWIAASDANYAYFKSLEKVWKSMEITRNMNRFNNDKAYQLFRSRVHMEPSPVVQKNTTMRRALFVAAVLLPFLVLGFFALQYAGLFNNPVMVSRIEAPNGSKTQATLADGTVVWLNAGSSLVFPPKFGKTERRVSLLGEASFKVAPNAQCPFIVETSEMAVKVLGTTFNVHAYPETGDTKVALLEGAVKLLPKLGDAYDMEAGQLAIYNRASGQINIHQSGVQNAFGWQKNKLTFEAETFEQIVCVLERTYGVTIQIHNEALKQRKFGGDFYNNSIEEIMKVVSTNQNFTYTIKENQIDIY